MTEQAKPDFGNAATTLAPRSRWQAIIADRVLSIEVALGAFACVLCPLLFFNSPGTEDFAQWLRWLQLIERDGFFAAYHEIIDNNPPLAEGGIWLASALRLISPISEFASIKLVILLAGYLSTAIFWWWRCSGVASLCVLWVAFGMMWGYLDVFFLPPLLLALWLFKRERFASGGVLYAMACFTKWQPLIIGPFLLAYAWKRGAGWRFLASLAGVAAAFYAIFGHALVPAFLLSFQHNTLSGYALNLPWLVEILLQRHGAAEIPACRAASLWDWHCVTASAWALTWGLKALFVLAYGYVLASFLRRDATFADLVFASLAGVMAYFAFNTGVHENHLFLAAILASIYASEVPRPSIACTLVLVLAIANPLIFYGFDGSLLPSALGGAIGVSVPMAELVILVALYLIWSATRPRRAA